MHALRKAIAIDFDGCLCTDEYPEIGKPNWPVIELAKQERLNGAGLILWTCREGVLLETAIQVCRRWGLTFDAINESLPDWIEAFGNAPRKVGATEYWDDRAFHIASEAIDNTALEEAIHIYENSRLFGSFTETGLVGAYIAGLAALYSAKPRKEVNHAKP